MGESIFVQSDDNRVDEYRSLRERFLKAGISEDEQLGKKACQKWLDVRSFGQVFAFKKGKTKKDDNPNGDSDKNNDAVSIGIRGPVTIQSAFSVEPIVTDSLQITKSVNLETSTPPNKKGDDTMGMKHRVGKGIYVTYGAINTQLASKTAFSDEDAEKIKNVLRTLFVNDASSARPEGSMEVLKVIWWPHSNPTGNYSSAKVHRSLKVNPDGSYTLDHLEGLTAQELDPLEGDELQKLSK